MVISVEQAERLSRPEMEEEVLQLEKLIDYNIKKYYPRQIPPVKFSSSLPQGVIRRIREMYMAGGWIINLVTLPGDASHEIYLHIINPERPY